MWLNDIAYSPLKSRTRVQIPPPPLVTIELSKRERERERERERVYWGSLKWGSKDEQVGECMTSREKNDPLELRGKRISQSHGKDKLV